MLIKICGLTSIEEAAYLNKNKVDFAGFVLFFPKSKRNLTIEEAKPIMRALDESIKKVAVVVSPTLEQVKEIEQAGFDYIQIHGQVVEGVYEETAIPVLRAFNGIESGELQACLDNDRVAGFVFDAAEPGSGKAFDWSSLESLPKTDKLVILAGGLTAENVAEAIRSVSCIDGVDVSSGVEIAADIRGKDSEKIDAFVNRVRS